MSLQSPETESSESSESVESTSEDNVGSMIAHADLNDHIIRIMRIIHTFLNTSFVQTSEESDSESDEDVSLAIFSKSRLTRVRSSFYMCMFSPTVKLYGRNQR